MVPLCIITSLSLGDMIALLQTLLAQKKCHAVSTYDTGICPIEKPLWTRTFCFPIWVTWRCYLRSMKNEKYRPAGYSRGTLDAGLVHSSGREAHWSCKPTWCSSRRCNQSPQLEGGHHESWVVAFRSSPTPAKPLHSAGLCATEQTRRSWILRAFCIALIQKVSTYR